VDLSILANAKLTSDPHAVKQWSLSSLAQELTCKQVEKVQSIRTGDWEADPLSQPQLLYAATDSFASWHLYQVTPPPHHHHCCPYLLHSILCNHHVS
jgi:ribonuclease D